MLLNTEYDHEVALLIATHKCDSTHEKRRGLQKALEHALERFPASSIFVCDNARDEAPPDATWMLVADIVEDTNIQEQVHYVYLPVGNKTLAFFWTIDVWIPILEEAKMCPRFKYIMMIDDDVAVPARLQFPIRALNKEEDVQAYAYAINCFTNTKEQAKDAPMLVRYQNIEYLLAGFFKQFQSSYGTALACHGAISLWRRDILVSKILWDHDTIFNGEDLQMGLLLHSMKQGHKIGCSARHLVQTDPPDHLYMLWQQRVKSWDVTAHRKTVTFLKIALLHWCGGLPSLILKPFLFMELFNIIQDWARIFFFAYLLTYNEGRIHLLQWILYLFLLQWIFLWIFYTRTLKYREDIRESWHVFVLYPVVYKPLSQVFRWYALLENIVRESVQAGQMRVREMEELEVLPPKPIMPPNEIDWRTVWTAKPPLPTSDDDKDSGRPSSGRNMFFV